MKVMKKNKIDKKNSEEENSSENETKKENESTEEISDLEKLKKENDEYLGGWQRALADIANLKKNHEEEKKLFTSLGKENIVLEIIPVLDNFDAAFSNKEVWNSAPENWRVGVEYIYKQLLGILENEKIESFGSSGEIFDPKIHFSLEKIKSEKKEDSGKISDVIQKGYKKEEKILREAKVKIFE